MNWIAYEAKEPPKIPEKQHEVFLLGQHNDTYSSGSKGKARS